MVDPIEVVEIEGQVSSEDVEEHSVIEETGAKSADAGCDVYHPASNAYFPG